MPNITTIDHPKTGFAETGRVNKTAKKNGFKPAKKTKQASIAESIDLENAHRQFLHEVCFSWLPKFVTLFLTRTLGNSLFAVKVPKQANPTNSSTQDPTSEQKKQISLKPIWDELYLEAGEGLTVYYLVVLLGSLIAKTFSKQLGVPNYELAGMTYRKLKKSINSEIEVGFKNKEKIFLTPEIFDNVTRLKFLSVLGATSFGIFEQFCLPFYRNLLSVMFLNTGSFFEISGLPETGSQEDRDKQKQYIKERAIKFMKWASVAFAAFIGALGMSVFKGRGNKLEKPKYMDKILDKLDFENFFGFSRLIFILTLGTDWVSYTLAARKDLKTGKNPELGEVIRRACLWVLPCAFFLKEQMANLCTWIIGKNHGVKEILTPVKEMLEINQPMDFNRVHTTRIEKLPEVQSLSPKQKESLFLQIKRAKNVYVYAIALSIGIGVNILNFFKTRSAFENANCNNNGTASLIPQTNGLTMGKYLSSLQSNDSDSYAFAA